MNDSTNKFNCWMLLEILGHKRLAGYVTEEEHFGQVLCRIDIPEGHTQYFPASSIFSCTPITEDLALEIAEETDSAPISEYSLTSRHELKGKIYGLEYRLKKLRAETEVDAELDEDGETP